MSETMAEVDTGVLPTIRTLGDQLGDTTGAVERTFEASYTWRDAISEVKNATVAYLGPAGDMLAGVGGLAVGVATMGPHLAAMASKTGLVGVAQKALNLVMSLNPIGLVIAAVGSPGGGLRHMAGPDTHLPSRRMEHVLGRRRGRYQPAPAARRPDWRGVA